MKTTILVLGLALGGTLTAEAQSMLRTVSHVAGPTLKSSVEHILKDYPNAFRNVMGAETVSNPEFTEFECTTPPTGAISAHFSKFNTPNGNVVSFEALMFRSEDFKAASAKYKAICNELKRGIINMGKHRPYIMDGTYNQPSEEKGFSETLYALMPSDDVVEKLKIVVTMEFVFPEWDVCIKMYDKGADTEMMLEDDDDDM